MKEGILKGKRALLAFAAAAILAVGLMGLAGCGSSSSSESSDSSAAAGSSSAAATTEYDTSAYDDVEAVTMIWGAAIPVGGISDQWIRAVAEDVEARTGGKLKFDLYLYSDLGSNSDIMRQIQTNDVQVYYTEPATLTSFIPELAVFDCPMIFNGYTGDQIETVLNGDNKFTQKLAEGFDKAGVKNLMWLQDGTYRQVTSNKELRTLEDYDGFQIRTMENAYHMAFWEAVGAEPTPLAFAEVYFALQNGTVNGQENALFTSVSNNFQEVQKYVCFTNHILYSGQIIINNDAWDSLDPKLQDALMESVKVTHDKYRAMLTQDDQDNLKVMTDAGMEAIEYDDQFFADFLAKDGVKKVYSDISEATDGLPELLQAELEKTKA